MKIIFKIIKTRWFRSILLLGHLSIIVFGVVTFFWLLLTLFSKNCVKVQDGFIPFDLKNLSFKLWFYFILMYFFICILKFFIMTYYFEKKLSNYRKQNYCKCPHCEEYKFSYAWKSIGKSLRNWWNE